MSAFSARIGRASTTDEAEANQFAMELLMPEEWLRGDVGIEPLTLMDCEILDALANRYQVDGAVMALRLRELGLLR